MASKKTTRHKVVDPVVGEMQLVVTVHENGSIRIRWDMPKGKLWRQCYYWNGSKNPSVAFTPAGS